MLPDLFAQRMQLLLGKDYDAFLSSYDRPRNVGLRINPLKSDVLPDLSRFSPEPIPWESNGYYYNNNRLVPRELAPDRIRKDRESHRFSKD